MHPALHTPICDKLGMAFPIVQTGMGWVATPEHTSTDSTKTRGEWLGTQ